ncbi:DUF4396 domain-containing protein [Cobetia marina]|jgi:uncharacterized integral membrane protein|uniref:DUF4396 domain-containing protein n=1 Tax=Cobetia marina TaxID=28258 RepID=A0ABU9GGC5_COBMA|nr:MULTISPECIES: DUF4396 domain-containing protein [Cobetia]AOM01758.1 copper oxidase [Cobetia marina]AZV31615.1 DUF4396 domain-containing protein [Cobetia sp. ICG0124]MDA5562309.1 DUF4396 domain-containing protein [Cobetia sp. MMG027]MDH2292974.1 DUF4396 domain-containing protein [Cobetia sp. 10Alg 146]MDI6002253.1 DUF4396 domain-containing protein [Cobetia pacifica]
MQSALRDLLSDWSLFLGWLLLMLPSLVWVLRDLTTSNAHLAPMMKWVWGLTTLYSGIVGLLVYRFAGRRQIADNRDARKGLRSVAHCYSGCGLGEFVGVVLAVGLLALGNFATAIITFLFAYLFGFLLTVGPMLQAGSDDKRKVIQDAFRSETASIFVMELVAISVDLWLGGRSGMHDALFWNSMVISLSLGLLAAWPVNVWLVKRGIKGGMADPRETDPHAQHHAHC